MFKLILRSTCVGIASIVLAAFAAPFIALAYVVVYSWRNPQQSGELEIGWDLITLRHNHPLPVVVIPLAVFVVGFFIGFRYFSKTPTQQISR